ncbi:hypothetical protein ABZ897_60315 [Nonomuraea sp. NPDC046802]|uniref:hypothetical protein n=1 Tax=Nonomuraea sp. NPDC046802 TaxID=3154919 RepID=UPI0033C07512
MKWFLLLVFGVAALFVSAWALMLLVGVLHHELSPAIPAIGYTDALPISFTLGVFLAIHKGFSAASCPPR